MFNPLTSKIMNKKAVLFLIHLPVWILVLSVVLIIYSDATYLNSMTFAIIQSLNLAFWFLTGFYVFYLYLVPKYLENGNVRTFALLSALFVLIVMPGLIISLDRLSFLLAGFKNLAPSYLEPKKIIYAWMGASLTTLVCGGFGAFYRFGIDWFKNLEMKKDLENKNLQSELRTLKSKLNPHLLFNTLNNIDTFIQTSPEQASVALSQLSDLLRYVVYDTEKEKVSIQEEIEYLHKYIDLERIRLVNPDSVEFTSNVTSETAISPMIFFPFVENGFKHSDLNDPGHRLIISISADKSKILFNCKNTIFDKIPKNSDSGMGLILAKKRLDLLYPGTHKLTLGLDGNEFLVTLEIDVE